MASRRASLLISLRHNALEAALIERGQPVSAQVVALKPGEFDRACGDQFRSLDAALSKLLTELPAPPGANATLVYDGEHTAAELTTSTAPPAALLQAARLAALERRGAARTAIDADLLTLDHAADDHARHALVVSDAESNLDALRAWLDRAGITDSHFIPRRALLLTQIFRRVTGPHAAKGCPVCWIDHHATAIGSGAHGVLGFVRVFDLGSEHLVDAVCRALRGSGLDAAERPADPIAARRLLREFGIPDRDQAFGAVQGRDVLPLLQPVLQRACVEIKQTLRFGTADERLIPKRLFICGPGAAIPGLEDVISESLDLPVEREAPPQPGEPADVAPPESLAAAEAVPTLVPAVIQLRNQRRRAARLVRLGAVLAGVFLAVDAGVGVLVKRDLATQLDRLQPAAQAIERDRALAEHAQHLNDSLRDAATTLADRIGPEPDWSVALVELSRLTGDQIRLTEIAGHTRLASPRLDIAAVAKLSQHREASPVAAFIDRAIASGLFEAVTLGSARLDEIEGRPVQRFVVHVELRAAPALSTLQRLADQNEPASDAEPAQAEDDA